MKFQIKVTRKATAELCEMNRICFVGICVWNGYFQADVLKWKMGGEQESSMSLLKSYSYLALLPKEQKMKGHDKSEMYPKYLGLLA